MKVHDAELALENATLLDKVALLETALTNTQRDLHAALKHVQEQYDRAETAERALADAKLRTPGTIELCPRILGSTSTSDDGDVCKWNLDGTHENRKCGVRACPLRPAAAPEKETP